jgi:hypothetical protein
MMDSLHIDANEALRRQIKDGIDALERGDYIAIRTDAEMQEFFQEIRRHDMKQN